MAEVYPSRDNVPEAQHYLIRIRGAGAANPTKELGPGVTVTWVSTGRYRFTFSEAPGVFVGATKAGLQATTPNDVDLWDTVFGSYDATNRRIDVFVYSAANTLADLTSTNWMFVDLIFKATAV